MSEEAIIVTRDSAGRIVELRMAWDTRVTENGERQRQWYIKKYDEHGDCRKVSREWHPWTPLSNGSK